MRGEKTRERRVDLQIDPWHPRYPETEGTVQGDAAVALNHLILILNYLMQTHPVAETATIVVWMEGRG